MAKPSLHPDFATGDMVDPVSGANNVEEPTADKKSRGWDRHERPPRQWMNWIHRVTALWTHYLEEITDTHTTEISDLDNRVGTVESDLNDVEAELAAATSANSPDTLMLRDAAGRSRVTDPLAGQDIATKAYVDSAVAGYFPSGTKMVFYQDAAPPNWTLDATINDRALIAVNSGGGTTGGSWTISGLTVGGTALSVNQLPAHTHQEGTWENTSASASAFGFAASGTNQTTPTGAQNSPNVRRALTSATGSGQTHNHSMSHNGTWRPAYAKVIICTAN